MTWAFCEHVVKILSVPSYWPDSLCQPRCSPRQTSQHSGFHIHTIHPKPDLAGSLSILSHRGIHYWRYTRRGQRFTPDSWDSNEQLKSFFLSTYESSDWRGKVTVMNQPSKREVSVRYNAFIAHFQSLPPSILSQTFSFVLYSMPNIFTATQWWGVCSWYIHMVLKKMRLQFRVHINYLSREKV